MTKTSWAFSLAALALAPVPLSAQAATPKISELFASGFEVKAAFTNQTVTKVANVLILQKGKEVYQCSTERSRYSNSYLCDPVIDWTIN